MLKLIKYEFRKTLVPIAILAALVLGSEVYAFCSTVFHSETHMVISTVIMILIALAGTLIIFFAAIQSYQRELHSKSSYLLFMTPNSSYKIIGSKILTTLITALTVTVEACIFTYFDVFVMIREYLYDAYTQEMDILAELSRIFNYSPSEFLVSVLVFIITFWLSVVTSICIAYLAITLSMTLLSNSKANVFVSIVFFFVLTGIINWISGLLPLLTIGTGITQDLLASLPAYIFDVIIMIGCIIGSGALLEKKISL